MQLALKQPADGGPAASAAIDVAKPKAELPINTTLQRMAEVAKTSPLKVMREYVALAFGPGQISFRDYTRLRMFDDAFYAGTDKRAIVGQRRNSDIDLTINYRHDWIGLFSNKVASASYLAAYGFPTIPVLAFYAEKLASSSPAVLRTREELRDFLTREDSYPLFGKPTEGIQSLGSIGIRRSIAGTGGLETIDGQVVALEDVLSDIITHYSRGYVFQKFLSPHPSIQALCGDRLATVRIVTLASAGEPQIFRACWKIPAGSNIADNYWRPGNLLARIDLATGRVLRATSGTGLELIEHTHHLDTNAPLIGMQIPDWEKLTRTAIEAARLMQHMPLIGFDMALTRSGPVIVEMNHNPDFFLNQLADGRGVLDAKLLAFIADQKRLAAERVKLIKREARQL